METLATLRDSTQSSLRGRSCYLTISSSLRLFGYCSDLESMFDDEGRFILSVETRETVHELRSELSKSTLGGQ